MANLASQKCVPCEGGVPPLSVQKAQDYLQELNREWQITPDGKKLTRKFKFPNFREALAFVNKVAAIAESEDHHPNIEFGWGFVKLTLWTHAINGLFDNDFILAAKIDKPNLNN